MGTQQEIMTLEEWLYKYDYLTILDAYLMHSITEGEFYEYLGVRNIKEIDIEDTTTLVLLDELSDKLWTLEETVEEAVPKLPLEVNASEVLDDADSTYTEIGARKMAVEMYNMDYLRYFLPILTIVMVVLCFAIIGFIIWNPNNMRDSLSISVLELCKNILILIMGFYFGSSIGSKSKDVRFT